MRKKGLLLMELLKRRVLPVMIFAVAAACTTAPPPANSLTVDSLRRLPAQTYALQPGDAAIDFAARPRAFPAVTGTFSDFEGEVQIVDAAVERIDVRARVDLDSVVIGSDWYENLIRSDNWFAVEKYPEAIFVGSLEGWDGEGTGTISGEMTIRGVTRPAEFAIRLNCDEVMGCPVDRVGFIGEIELSRSEYGMTDMRALVRDKVQLTFSGELVASDQRLAKAN